MCVCVFDSVLDMVFGKVMIMMSISNPSIYVPVICVVWRASMVSGSRARFPTVPSWFGQHVKDVSFVPGMEGTLSNPHW